MQVNRQGLNSSTQQGGMVWNGSQWVQSGSSYSHQTNGQYSSYSHSTTDQAQPSVNPSDQAKYRFYYQQAQELRQAAMVQSLPPSEKEELLRKAKWSDYYSSQAYYGKSGVPDIPTTTQSSPESVALPSPPPAAAAADPTSTQQQAQPPPTSGAAGPKLGIPDSLKRYVQAMLKQCKTEAEKNVAKEMVQRVIQNAVKTNTLWTTNWDNQIPGSDSTLEATSKVKNESTSFSISNPKQSVSPIPSQQPSQGVAFVSKASVSSESHALGLSNGDLGSSKTKRRISSENSYSYYGPSDIDTKPLSASRDAKKKQKKETKKDNSGFDTASDTMAARASRFSVDLKKTGGKSKKNDKSVEQQYGQYMGASVVGGHSSSKMMDENEYEKMTVKGTCQKLEKEFLRLTAPPKAELVRPEPVLQKHLLNLKKLWSKRKRDYVWMCSQLKAIRQDLTVQRINNELTVEVYETHARVALEESDLNEYNQCQTQLKDLYLKMQKEGNAQGTKHLHEFLAYRLIYFVFLTFNKKYEGGSSDLLSLMLSLTMEQKEDRCISHALKVRSAVAESNYHSFFRLYQNSPKMSGFLLDHMLQPMRFASLQRMVKAYRPNISVAFVLKNLGIDLNDKKETKEGLEWIKSCGCVLKGGEDDKCFADFMLNAKDTVLRESTLKKKSSLI